MINFENLDKFTFPGVGKYDIPQIEPVKAYPQGEFIPVNYHYTAKDSESKIVHPPLEHAGQVHPEAVRICGGVCAGLLHVHRYAAGDADLQPLSQALVSGILAAPRPDGVSDHRLERRTQL